MTSLLICSGHIADILLVLEQWQISLSRLDGCNVHPACDRQDKIRTPKQKAFIKRQNMAAVGLRSAPVSTPPGFPSTTWLQLCYMPVGCSIENLIRGALPIPTSVESKLDELRLKEAGHVWWWLALPDWKYRRFRSSLPLNQLKLGMNFS